MRFRKVQKEEPRLGITPLIDIVFLLLIFFMLTSHFHMASGIPIQLPQIGEKGKHSGKDKLVLVMNDQGGLYLNGEKIKTEELHNALKNRLKKEEQAGLVVEADKDVSHGDVVRIMDISKKAGVSSIIIAAKWKPEDKDLN